MKILMIVIAVAFQPVFFIILGFFKFMHKFADNSARCTAMKIPPPGETIPPSEAKIRKPTEDETKIPTEFA